MIDIQHQYDQMLSTMQATEVIRILKGEEFRFLDKQLKSGDLIRVYSWSHKGERLSYIGAGYLIQIANGFSVKHGKEVWSVNLDGHVYDYPVHPDDLI